MYLVKDCPDFYFMPSLHFDKVSKYWGPRRGGSFWDCPEYWKSRGWPVFELVTCEPAEAELVVSETLCIYAPEDRNLKVLEGFVDLYYVKKVAV